MVEAGGVEPPSEEPNGQETTCLSRSLTAFADGPKERATTNRRLASIPPQRILPEAPRRWTPNQPANRRLFPLCGPEGGDGYLIN